LVVTVTGPPGAGKTVLGKRLAHELRLPFIGKDDIKEFLFETLGWEDRRWSMQLGAASFEILFHVLERQLAAGKPAVVETAFHPHYHTARFLGLRDEYGFEPVQILCSADGEVLFDRFVQRTASGKRHPGHVDDLMSYRQFAEMLRERGYGALEIGGLLIEIDTTDFHAVDVEGLARAISAMTHTAQDELTAHQRVVAEIRRRLSDQQAPVVVALDGGSGAGKSTLASLIEDELEAALIPLDDFFSAAVPQNRWDEFTVDEKLERVFDWDRVRDQAIEPLLQGKPARWHAFDFEAGLRPDGTYGMQAEVTKREPADVVVIEGAYSAGPALADLVDLAILVDVPVEERHARLRSREDREFLETWHRRWDPLERYYFNDVRPQRSFDLVVRP
jgi:uridine kinase/predicted kinase